MRPPEGAKRFRGSGIETWRCGPQLLSAALKGGERVGTIEGDRDQQRRRSGERQVHVQLTFEHGLLPRSSICMYHKQSHHCSPCFHYH